MDNNNSSALFRRKYGSFRRFFKMLGKAGLPYVWIIATLAASVLITQIGVNTTEYSAKLFSGNVGFATVVLPYLFFTILSLFLGTLSGLVDSLCTVRIDRNLRRMAWRKIVKLPLRFFEDNNPKELVSRITTDVTSVSQLLMQVFLRILTTGYSSFVILQRISTYSGALMWSLVAVLPLNIFITFILGRMRFGVSDLINRRNAQLTGEVGERTNNLLLIKTMASENREDETVAKRMADAYKAQRANIWITGLSGPMQAIAGVLQTVVIIMVGRGFYSDGTLELTQWIAYYGFAVQLTNILTTYCGYWSSFKNAQGAVDRLSQVMDEPDEDINSGEDAGTVSGGIDVEDVDFAFGEKVIFDGLTLHIPAGRITAVVGPSGCGKTTLLNLIDRLYPLAGGKISIGGRDTGDYSLASLRHSIGYVTQECVMYSGTIRENLCHGLGRVPDEAELDEVCSAVGILNYVREQPLGYDTPVDEGGTSLSGGQRQRFSVAHGLLKKPDCLLLDEATAAMDINGKAGVWQSIRTRMAGKTVLFVAHDAQTLSNADYIIVLRGGRVEAAGERDMVIATNDYCYEMMAGGARNG